MPERSQRHRIGFLIRLWLATVLGIALGASSAANAADIDVKVRHFGAADLLRAGGPVAVQLELRSALTGPVEVEIAWELPNADGDVAEHVRRVVLNPGQATRRWVYGTLPPFGEGTLRDEIYSLRLFAIEGGERVRDLGTVKIAPRAPIAETEPQFLAPEVDGIAVVGPRTYGLDIFAQARANNVIPSMHTVTSIGNIREEDGFPDRWEGYATLDALVWGGNIIPPSRLSDDSAQALLEWVERGGSLIIALPAAGDPWSIGTPGRHAFSAILPATAPTRIDDVRVSSLLPLLSVSDTLRAPDARTRLAIFDPSTLKDGWRPFIAIPARRDGTGKPEISSVLTAEAIDGALIGIRKEYGFGHITLLGIDVEELAARGLQTPAIPQGDVFWNRILGRRADTPSGAEYTALDDTKRLAAGGYSEQLGEGNNIASEIGLAGEAAVGVLAATAVFTLYWLIAGPFGFALLKMFKREKWAWVAYVGVAAAFSLGIWVIGGTLSGSDARIKHLTVLDMVERAPGEADPSAPQWRRATGWFSLYAPSYGSTRVELDPSTDGRAARRNLLTSWRSFGSTVEGFPSRERYEIELDSPGAIDAPSRATSIDFRAEWLGALEEGWGRLPAIAEPIAANVNRSSGTPQIELTGMLRHELPGPLEDVIAIHIWPAQNPLQSLKPVEVGKAPERRFVGQLPNRGTMVSLQRWNPGDPLDLAKVFPPAAMTDRLGLARDLDNRYYAPIYNRASQFNFIMIAGGDELALKLDLEMLSLYGMMQPPAYLQNPPSDPSVLRLPRFSERGLDLSNYFTQPCLIVMGWVDAALPYPLRVDGEKVPSEGRVFVRWVMPLPGELASVIPDRVPRSNAPLGPAPSRDDESATEEVGTTTSESLSGEETNE